MARENTRILGIRIEPQHLRPEPSPTLPGRFARVFFRHPRWRPPHRNFIPPREAGPAFPPFELGTSPGEGVIEQVSDGDITVDEISGPCVVTLESRHGSITIIGRIEQGAHAKLKAAKTVTVGKGIGQHSTVEIVAGADVTIRQSIDDHSRATITARTGTIAIGTNVDNYSEARLTAGTVHIAQGIDEYSTAIITATGDVVIGDSINWHSTADVISLKGTISIARIVTGRATALLTAGGCVHIGGKLDQYSHVTVLAQEDVTIGQKIDQHAVAKITSLNSSINIGQGLSGSASATLSAVNGCIKIGDLVDSGSTVNWNASSFICPRQNGAINRIR
jgi:hypothetical protein